ncbi:pentapeptide repeat-containing protein [Salininema proteolyticum]|uniref:Pentapeptide repeat-containing protein n=1 Tax=Salininema proteolyticum TaxID=1607685 RepID=A0ABV8U400_9ACTN
MVKRNGAAERPRLERDLLVEAEMEAEMEADEALLSGLEWTGGEVSGHWRSVLAENSDFSGSVFDGMELADTAFEKCVLSNSAWREATARRVALSHCQAIGWEAQLDVAEDLVVTDSRLDYAGLSLDMVRGAVRFERCRFKGARFVGNLSRVRFVDCDLGEADFSRVNRARDLDLRGTSMDGATGVMALKGAVISPDQAIAMAGMLAAEAGFTIAGEDGHER